MSVIRVGSTSTYAAGWDAIFGGGRAGRGKAGAKKARAAAGKAAKRKISTPPKGVKAAGKAKRKPSARTKR